MRGFFDFLILENLRQDSCRAWILQSHDAYQHSPLCLLPLHTKKPYTKQPLRWFTPYPWANNSSTWPHFRVPDFRPTPYKQTHKRCNLDFLVPSTRFLLGIPQPTNFLWVTWFSMFPPMNQPIYVLRPRTYELDNGTKNDQRRKEKLMSWDCGNGTKNNRRQLQTRGLIAATYDRDDSVDVWKRCAGHLREKERERYFSPTRPGYGHEAVAFK